MTLLLWLILIGYAVPALIGTIYGAYVREGGKLTQTVSDGLGRHRTYYYDRHGERLYDKPSKEDYAYEKIRGARLIVRWGIWPIYLLGIIGLGIPKALTGAGKAIGATVRDGVRELPE